MSAGRRQQPPRGSEAITQDGKPGSRELLAWIAHIHEEVQYLLRSFGAINDSKKSIGGVFVLEAGDAEPAAAYTGQKRLVVRRSGNNVLAKVLGGSSLEITVAAKNTTNTFAESQTFSGAVTIGGLLTAASFTVTGAVTFAGNLEIDGDLNHDGANAGFRGSAPVAATTFTQTYATASNTHAALTSAALTDNSGGTANTTVQALTDPADAPASADALRDDMVATLIPELRNNLADLTAQINALRVDLANAKNFINGIADALQVQGLAA